MSKRDPVLLVGDILDSAAKILDYTKGLTFEDFTRDSKTAAFKNCYPDIDWHRIRGFRNRIVHDYFGIDYSIVWLIKETFLPKMITQLQRLSKS